MYSVEGVRPRPSGMLHFPARETNLRPLPCALLFAPKTATDPPGDALCGATFLSVPPWSGPKASAAYFPASKQEGSGPNRKAEK